MRKNEAMFRLLENTRCGYSSMELSGTSSESGCGGGLFVRRSARAEKPAAAVSAGQERVEPPCTERYAGCCGGGGGGGAGRAGGLSGGGGVPCAGFCGG